MHFEDTVKNMIAGMSALSAQELCDEDTLISIGINSLRAVELIVSLEDAFAVTFEDDALDPAKLETVGSIIDLVNHYVDR